ncbi:MAG: hypothetical protein QOG39_1858 [Acidimicrobiaceae bacterium]
MKGTPAASEISFVRKLLLTIMVIGAMGSTFGAGTLASYNASTTNASSTFETGTVTLSNLTPVTNTTCFSYGASASGFSNGNANTCDSVFALTAQTPTSTPTTVNLTLQNVGDQAGGTLVVFPSVACTGTTAQIALCSAIQLTIQETNSSFTATACRYDIDNTGTTCALDPTRTLTHFGATYSSASPNTLGGTGMAVSAFRYFQIKIQLPLTNSDNSIQSTSVSFGFTWALQ